MTSRDRPAIRAAEKWCRFKGIQLSYTSMVKFTEWLGDPLTINEGWYSRQQIIDMTKPEIKRKVDLINSSHGDTILKIMEIQREQEDRT